MKTLNKKVIIAAVVIIVGAAGIFMLTRPEKQLSPVLQETAVVKPLATEQVDHSLSSPTVGQYVDYSDTIIASTAGTKVLFFHAPWCPQCRAIDKSIKEQGVPKGVTVIKIDYDTNNELRKKYGVTLQTTLVRVSDDGTLEKKFVAYDNPSVESLQEVL